MIQRRQSIFLLLITIIVALMLWMDQPYYSASGKMTLEDRTYEEKVEVGYRSVRGSDGTEKVIWPLVLMESVIGLLAFATIFLYKNRPLQARMGTINFILIIGLIVFMYFYSFNIGFTDSPYNQKLEYPAVIPLALLILNYLAVRRINADEKLVKSLDRIR